ncbi:MAG: C40 family peptidase [Burkholderiales bacterium]|nr:C40 family peptidase [Burkholderiales bacterium]
MSVTLSPGSSGPSSVASCRGLKAHRLLAALATASLLAACSSVPMSHHAASYGYRTGPFGADHSAGQEEITLEAMGLVGVPYRWGGNTPASGFDCSGLVKYVVQRAAGVDLPRTAAQMSTIGTPVSPRNLASGDLVFFDTDGRPDSHVGIYVGKGLFVHAPKTGGTVSLANMNLPYWIAHYNGARRVAAERAPAEVGSLAAQRSAPAAPLAEPESAPQSPGPTQPAQADNATAPLPDSPAAAPLPSDRASHGDGNDSDPIARFASNAY